MSKNVKVLILAQTGTDGTTGDPIFTVVGGQRNASLSESAETIDVTSNDSNGANEFDYGLSTWTISCDGIYVPSDTAYVALKDAIRNKTNVLVQVQEDGVQAEQGTALVISREVSGSYNGETTYTVELQGTGQLA
jgi:TP901-1 family phage major tail protein